MPIMFALSTIYKSLSARLIFKKPFFNFSCCTSTPRSYADKAKSNERKPTKHIAAQGTENDDRLRVRRARPSDVPRVLRFVREHAATAWPGLNVPPPASYLVLCDYVARALAQGHSLVAENHEGRRGWSQIKGLALGTSVCPWDAALLDRWARCIRCDRSKRLLQLTAHCLRAPSLHDKYGVNNILQVILLVPNNSPKASDVANILAKNAIQRSRDVGFPLIRFDVTDKIVAQALEQLKLTKEWQLSSEILPEPLKDQDRPENTATSKENETKIQDSNDIPKQDKFFIVYSSVTVA